MPLYRFTTHRASLGSEKNPDQLTYRGLPSSGDILYWNFSIPMQVQLVQNSELIHDPQQSPPSKLHSRLFASSLQIPSPIKLGWVQSVVKMNCRCELLITITVPIKNAVSVKKNSFDFMLYGVFYKKKCLPAYCKKRQEMTEIILLKVLSENSIMISTK